MKYVGRKARKGSLFMYQNNIYIDNYEELSAITLPYRNKADMGVQFDIFD